MTSPIPSNQNINYGSYQLAIGELVATDPTIMLMEKDVPEIVGLNHKNSILVKSYFKITGQTISNGPVTWMSNTGIPAAIELKVERNILQHPGREFDCHIINSYDLKLQNNSQIIFNHNPYPHEDIQT